MSLTLVPIATDLLCQWSTGTGFFTCEHGAFRKAKMVQLLLVQWSRIVYLRF